MIPLSYYNEGQESRKPGGWGGGGVLWIHKWRGWSNEGFQQNTPKKTLDQKLTAKQSQAEFPSLTC